MNNVIGLDMHRINSLQKSIPLQLLYLYLMSSIIQAMTRYYQQVMSNPNNYQAIFQIGLIQYQHQQYQEALEHFTKAYQHQYQPALSAQYIGNIYYYQQQDQTALQWFQISLAINKLNDSLYNSIAVIHKRRGNIEQAIRCFLFCLDINPKNSLAHYGMGNIYYDLRNYQQAIKHYNLSIEANPNYDAPYIGRGNVFRRLGRNEQASKQYLKSIHLNPSNQAALKNLRSLTSKQKLNEINVSEPHQHYEDPCQIVRAKHPIKQVQKPAQQQKKVQHIIRRSISQDGQQSQLRSQMRVMKEQFFSMVQQLTNCFNKIESSVQANQQEANVKAQAIKPNRGSNLSARDRQLLIQMRSGDVSELKQVQKWIQQMMNEVISTSFNYYLNNQMTYNQARVYCCQKILTNIYVFFSKWHHSLKPSFMYKINKFMEESLQYIKYKYPLNEELEVPYKLQHFISSNKKDNTDSIEYDYFAHFPYEFEYRESGIYNDIIMKMINQLIDITGNNYYSFKKTMTKLFENVFDPNWKKEQEEKKQHKPKHTEESRNQSRSPSPQHTHSQSPPIQKNHSEVHHREGAANPSHTLHLMKTLETHHVDASISQHQSLQAFQMKRKEEHQANRKNREHRQKVQSYTSYVIKRKIPEFVKCYSEQQIRNINVLKIKDKSIFRILTKWCEQLWQKFDIIGYFLNKVSIVMLKDKKLFYLSLNQKQELNTLIEEEREEIKKFILKISKDCNMKMQFHLLIRWLNYQDEVQNNTGIFTVNAVQSLEYFTVSYLNRIIHGLLKISKKFSQIHLDQTHPQLLLLTFKIKDLLRCRFKSKEQESQKILRHILEQTQIKVLRVKNRLNDNNNDIMINLFFEKMVCQIQLAVQTNTSKFIECSNNFNHFLYELERSYFGPITEMSNIWQCHDKRMKHYKKIEQKRIQSFKSKANSCQHTYQRIEEETQPFICSECNRIYYHYNYIVSHKRCVRCKAINCGSCRLANMHNDVFKKYLKVDFIDRYTDPSKQFPQLSYFLIRQCNNEQVGVYYIRYHKKCKNYLISIQNTGNSYYFETVTQLTDKTIKSLLKKYIIVEVAHSYQHIIFSRRIQEALFRQYISQTLSEMKDQLSLTDFIVRDNSIKHVIEAQLQRHKIKENKCKVKKVIIDRIGQQKIKKQNLDHIIWHFASLQYLWIANNHLEHLPKIKDPSQIIMINLQKTDLKEIQNHSQIQQFERLQFLIINHSQLKEIPKGLKNISTLVHLQICGSSIKHLHDSIFKHLGSTLVYLNLSVNQLQKLPESIRDLQKLQYLNVSDNQLIAFPSSIIYNISLTYLNLSQNPIRRIPQNLQNLINLQVLQLSNCELTVIFAQFSKFSKLSKVNISANKLGSISFLQNSKIGKQVLASHSCQQKMNKRIDNNIKLCHLGRCKKIMFTDIFLNEPLQQVRFTTVEQLTLNKCRITIIPDLSDCHSLKLLDLSTNLIRQVLPSDLVGLKQLKDFILNENPLAYFPSDFQELQKLQRLELDRCGLKGTPSFKNISKLLYLKLSNNHFQQIPDNLFECITNLKVLDIRNNSIIQEKADSEEDSIEEQSKYLRIGDRIDLLTDLQELYVSNCGIRQVPNIDKCTNLTVLRLQKNSITHFSNKLQMLAKLQVLRLDGNHISKLKDIQILGISYKILPSITIMRDLLANYCGSEEDSEEKVALNQFAIRLNNQIKEIVGQRFGQIIERYGQNLVQEITMVHTLLRIESEYGVINDYLNKINIMLQQGKFSKKYLGLIHHSFINRLYQIQNEEYHLLKYNKLKVHNYQVCYKQTTFHTHHFKVNVQDQLNKILKEHSDLEAIVQRYNQVRPVFIQSLRELIQTCVANSINIQVTIRYYKYLQQIVMPIDVKESKVVCEQEEPVNENLRSFRSKHPFYRFNTGKDKREISEKAYFISAAPTKLIASTIRI